MAVRLNGRVEKADQLVLRFWMEIFLAFEDDDLMLVERSADHIEVNL